MKRLMGVLWLAAVVAGASASAAEFSWSNPANGTFTDPANWASSVPGQDGPGGKEDVVVFGVGTDQTPYVVSGVAGGNEQMRIRQGVVTLNLADSGAGYSYLLADTSQTSLIVTDAAGQTASLMLQGDEGASLQTLGAIVGAFSGTSALLTVDGIEWDSPTIGVGGSGHGQVLVDGGAIVRSSLARLGYNGGFGTLDVVGAGSKLTDYEEPGGDVPGRIEVGSNGLGQLAILEGGQVLGLDGFIGHNPGSHTSSAFVTGPDSHWGGGELTVGGGPQTASLLIQQGGSVSFATAVRISDHGVATIRGLDSRMTTMGALRVGTSGSASLVVEGGGAMSANSVVLGDGGVGEGTVSGAGSSWSAVAIRISFMGAGSLDVADGGLVETLDLNVGNSNAGTPAGELTVGGAGARVRADEVFVGGTSPGRVTVNPGGTLEALQTFQVGAGGQVHLKGGKLAIPALEFLNNDVVWTSGTLRLLGTGVQVGSGGLLGEHVLLQNGKSLEIDGVLSVLPGATLFVGDSLAADVITIQPPVSSDSPTEVYVGGPQLTTTAGLTNNAQLVISGPTTINGSVNNAAGGAITALADVTFTGMVTGPGGFYGAGTKTFSGGFSPGASPAIVDVEGDIVLGDDNMLIIELGGVAPGEFDRLEVDGVATIDGDLDVRLIDEFVPSVGDSFGFLFAGGGFGGTFDNLLLPSLGAGKAWQLNPGGATVFLNVVAAPIYSADFDEDGDVDAADLAQWQGDFGSNGDSDADGDGDSDGADFLAWQQQLGSGIPAQGASRAAPEPASGVLLAAFGTVLASRRRPPRGVYAAAWSNS